jgi:dethiobiotin synthetase
MSTPRVFVVGTDTAVGKTSLVCALLSIARAQGRRVVPYKPAHSGAPGEISDADRLHAAAAIADLDRDDIVGFTGALPIAPGMIDDATSFLDAPRIDEAPLARARAQLDRAIDRTDAELAIVEGAGGLWVPMPGGTWQPRWIRELATHVVIVARASLGTINHTLCTIDALRSLDLAPLGFYTSETTVPDSTTATNARVIEHARDIPHLGTLPFSRAPELDLLAPLLERLA